MSQWVTSFHPQFTGLVARHFTTLRHYAARLIRPNLGLEPDDVVNTMVDQAEKHLSRQPIRDFLSWAWVAMRGIVRRHAHRRKIEQQALASHLEVIYCGPDPEALLLKNEEFAHLWKAIKKLSPAMAESLLGRLDDLSDQEIALELGINPKTISGRCQRAIGLLRDTFRRLSLIEKREVYGHY